MAFLTQSRFPTLWKAFQFWIGGSMDKQRLYGSLLDDPKNVLEVGCSLGNTANVFIRREGVRYTGIDIDQVVIEHAQRAFRDVPNAEFVCEDLRAFAAREQNQGRFDHVMFAGICHHIDDAMVVELLRAARALLPADGRVVVVDPLIPRQQDSWMLRTYMKHLEQGEHLREHEAMLALIEQLPEYELVREDTTFVGAMPNSWFKVARFGIYLLQPR